MTQDVTASQPSSDTPTPDVKTPAAASSTAAPDVIQQASSEPKGDERSELLKVVQDAAKADKSEGDKPEGEKAPGEPTPADQAAKPDAATKKDDGKDDDQLPELTDEEMKGYGKKIERRMRDLVRQRKEAEAKISTLETDAKLGSEFREFVQSNKLSAEDTDMLLGVGAALKRGDFQTFLNGVMPYVAVAQEALGVKLPKDLQAKVDEGVLDADTAREHAKLRSQVQLNQQHVQDMQQDRAASEAQQVVTAIRTAVTDWEASVRQRDPDFAAKQATVVRFSQALIAERGAPRTAIEGVKIAEEAYAEVNKLFGGIKPPLQPTRPTPNSGSQSATSATPEPRSLMEAAMLGLKRTG